MRPPPRFRFNHNVVNTSLGAELICTRKRRRTAWTGLPDSCGPITPTSAALKNVRMRLTLPVCATRYINSETLWYQNYVPTVEALPVTGHPRGI